MPRERPLTLFGATMAIADLGVMEMWCGFVSDLSLLTDRRNICEGRSAAGLVCFTVALYVTTTATYIHVEMATGACKTK